MAVINESGALVKFLIDLYKTLRMTDHVFDGFKHKLTKADVSTKFISDTLEILIFTDAQLLTLITAIMKSNKAWDSLKKWALTVQTKIDLGAPRTP